jgi:hypothetical protein
LVREGDVRERERRGEGKGREGRRETGDTEKRITDGC